MATKFLGKHRATIDAKHRVAVPKRLRDRVADLERDRFVITILPEGCLVLYPLSEWDRIERQIDERAHSSLGFKDARSLERELFANADEVSCDKQGRILLAEELMKRAGLEKDALFVGVRNRIELWDPGAWEQSEEERAGAFDTAAQSVLG